MIDICTVVFEPEIEALKLQARSIEIYGQHIGIDRIWVMVNDDSWIRKSWWGSMADRVEIYHKSALSTDWHENGWVSQQALKMLGAGLSDNAWCMILDAKTLLVRELDVNEILPGGRAATGSLPVYPVFEPSRQIVNELFGIDLPQQLGPGGVPFMVEPQLVRDMMVDIYRRTGQGFADYFQSQGMLTEFILYSGYVWLCDKTFDNRYTSTGSIRPVNLCHSEVDHFQRKMQEMQDPSTSTVSIHRNAWRQLNDQQKQQYLDLLQQKGLL